MLAPSVRYEEKTNNHISDTSYIYLKKYYLKSAIYKDTLSTFSRIKKFLIDT